MKPNSYKLSGQYINKSFYAKTNLSHDLKSINEQLNQEINEYINSRSNITDYNVNISFTVSQTMSMGYSDKQILIANVYFTKK